MTIEGAIARLGSLSISLPGAAAPVAGARTELGIRPEYVRIGREGLPLQVRAVEDIGRHKIVRGSIEGCELAAIIPEGGEIPADPHVSFDPRGINIYANSWRQALRG